jgi:ZIP family zinc transporter
MLGLIAFAMFSATVIGGALALRLRDNLHLILGFSAGAVVGVAFFDLLPEALELVGAAYEPSTVLGLTALGFICYLALDRLILFHGHDHSHTEDLNRGYFGAGAISFHSFLDGVGVGLAFQVSPAVGAIVAVAVLAHNFSDGINTVGMVLRGGGDRTKAFKWLVADALAPVLGIVATFFFTVPETTLGLLLALFAGFFLYIGASDLIPEAHHSHPVRWTTVSTILGVAVLYVIIHNAGI